MAEAKAKDKKIGLTLAELNARYNPNVIIPAKIREALKSLGDNALPSEEFRKLANISTTQLSQFADQFSEHHIPVRDAGRTRLLWAGTAAFAARAIEELNS